MTSLKKDIDTLKEARKVLKIEADAIRNIIAHLDRHFEDAVELILNTKGKVVISGLGKSGLVGQKIASTMASTGTPSYFLHPTEGAHGDLGILGRDDIVIAIIGIKAVCPAHIRR